MSHYIKTVVGAVLAIGMLNCFFTKDGFGKYVNLLSAVIVMAVILSPILNISKNISINTKNIDVKPLEIKGNTYIMEEFEERLSIEIADELKKKTNVDFSITVFAFEDGEDIKIEKIEISPYSKEYARLISEFTGVKEGSISQK